MTKTLTVHPTQPDPATILEAARIIQRGRLVAFPTETVYGLGANGLDPVAVDRIFAAKRRPRSDPLILHVSNAKELERVALLDGLEELVSNLAARFMPGALTLVLPKHPRVPLTVTAGANSVAVRVPNHAVALALIAASGVPIAAPSANLFSRPSPTSAAAVLEDLSGRIDAVLDGGEAQIGVESTVLSLIGAPRLLRPGGVPLEEIEELIGGLLLDQYVLSERFAQPSPGMLLKHYSPTAKLLLVAHGADLEQRVRSAAKAASGKLGLLLPSESLEWLASVTAERVDLGATHQQIASRLFAGMRALDAAGCDLILTHQLEGTGLGRAINDRLFRAASGNVIQG